MDILKSLAYISITVVACIWAFTAAWLIAKIIEWEREEGSRYR